LARPPSQSPTEFELQILKILWQSPPSLVRDVRAKLAEQGRRLAHTSLVTTLNTMVRKKYVERQRQGNAYVFTPRVTREEVSSGVVSNVVDRVFDGSSGALLLTLFDRSEVDVDELKELRRLLDRKIRDA
jgi:BlaI family transcriptional regulator, penicillinase repressor